MSIRIIIDPLKHVVYLPATYNLESLNADYLDDDVSQVIKVPAMIIKVHKPTPELYHFRSIGWNFTLMFKSVKQEDHWLITEWIEDPSPEMLNDLLHKGEMISFCN